MSATLDSLFIAPDQRQECENEIRELAYSKWIEAGRPSGRESEFWLKAEREWIAFKYVPDRSSATG